MGVERCDGERRIERVFRLVAFIKKGFLFVLFSCGCFFFFFFDKPVLMEEERFD